MNVLALDLGTSSVRGLVLDGEARPLPGALARRPITVVVADDGAATVDPHAYLAGLVACLDELADGGHLNDIELVASSSQWHSVVPLDDAGQPLGPVLTWLDTRPTTPPGAAGPADPAAFHRRTGAWWHRFYWTVRLPWLRERITPTPTRYGGLASYIFSQLLDDAPMSVSQASGTGMLDLSSLVWDPEACELAGVSAGQLPPVAPAGWHSRLKPAYARRWPSLAAARWRPPIGDGAASNVGSGCVDEHRVAVTVGTSAASRLVQPAPAGQPLPPLPDRLWRYRVDHDLIVTGTAFSAGGSLYAWARRELRLPEGAELEKALDGVGLDGPVRADPRLGGDRPPGLAPAGSGKLSGLGLSTTAVEIFAAMMDALCVQVAHAVGDIESTVGHRVEVVLGGGAVAASRWWREAFAARLAPRSVQYVLDPEIGATGAALLAIGRPRGASGLETVDRTDDR